MDRLWLSFLHCQLSASGIDVGLPPGEMGNSEVGHMNLGAGRIVYQDLLRINTAIADGTFFKLPALIEAVGKAKQRGTSLHLMGLVSPGGVHSSMEHLFALLRLAKEQDLPRVFVHAFTDGRDTEPRSAPLYLKQLETEMKRVGVGQIATVIGRYYAMDRDMRWPRTEIAYNALTLGEGERAQSALAAVESSYRRNRTDEFVLPTVITDPAGKPLGLVKDGDSVIFFNFRTDRPRQLTAAFVLENFETAQIRQPAHDPYLYKYKTPDPAALHAVKTFRRKRKIKDLYFATLTEYDKNLPAHAAFSPVHVNLPLARVLADRDLSQFHLAETEKYAHVTYFFNGGREEPFAGEVRSVIPSPKVATYDLKPEMSAYEITAALIQRLKIGVDRFLLVNYANADMVGHTGIIDAAVRACEVVDECVGRVVEETVLLGGACLITADHGNAEIMLTRGGGMETEHSTSMVPFIVVHENFRGKGEQSRGRLGDVAPTILHLLDIPVPTLMTGRNLVSAI
jgi:2,3-bisphosphoglycerate-independent phosphoglycerate mutase